MDTAFWRVSYPLSSDYICHFSLCLSNKRKNNSFSSIKLRFDSLIYVIYGAVWPPFYVLCSSVHICHVLRWLYNPIVALLGALCSSQIGCHWKVKINWKKLFIGSFGELLTTVLPFSLSSCNNRLSFHHLSRHVKVFSQWPKISICSWYSYIYMLRSSWVR